MLCLVLRPEGEVVVIEGIGGLGKTWAARAAFETARNSNRFDNYLWISLSRSCSRRRCIENIATCLSIDIGDEMLSSRIRVMIMEYLARRRFLLVLDNAYFVEDNILRYLGIPDPGEQSFGSKVIVTTRTGRAKAVVKPTLVITPQPLSYQASYDLLHEKIGKDVGPDLIENCFGLPLSLILLAGGLCDVPTQEEFINKTGLARQYQSPKVSVFTTMIQLVWFGYFGLPDDTTRLCFKHCLDFPDDEAVPVKDVIILWKAHDLIHRGYHEANFIGMEVLHVLSKHGLIHFEGDDHIRVHDVIRETMRPWREKDYEEELEFYIDNCVQISELFLRGNRYMRNICEDLFFCKGLLRVLDLSFTRIIILPQSISHLFYLRYLLLVECDHLEKIQHIGPLEKLEVLKASGCCSLKSVECGSFDRMRFLEVLDLSRTSIECLPSLAGCTELSQLLLQDCPCLKPEQGTDSNYKSCDTKFIRFPYGVSKKGAVRNLEVRANKDHVNWMDMLWLPSGLTLEL
jgi:hypothetical protein